MVGLWWPFTGMGKIRKNRLGYNMIYEEFCLVYVNFVMTVRLPCGGTRGILDL